MTSPISPEAVAQMVADLRAADKPLIQSGPFIQTRERLRTAADMLTTLAAENAMLRADQARDAALVDALSACKQVAETAREYSLPQMVMGANKCHDDISDLRIHADAILALRDKPAPAVTVQGELQESREYAQALEVELRDRTAKIERECKLAEAQVSRLLDLTNRMDDRLNALVSATEALGAMPEGYCFCSENRIGDDSKTHEPECEGLRSALRAIAGGGDE